VVEGWSPLSVVGVAAQGAGAVVTLVAWALAVFVIANVVELVLAVLGRWKQNR
jgi:hypothetical protein